VGLLPVEEGVRGGLRRLWMEGIEAGARMFVVDLTRVLVDLTQACATFVSNLRQVILECVSLITVSSGYVNPNAARKLHGSIFDRTGVYFCILGIGNFPLFFWMTLTLTFAR